MNIQRFTAPTSREALAKARAVFGDETIILFNRPIEDGVEVIATAEESLVAFDPSESSAKNKGAKNAKTAQPSTYKEIASKVEDDAAQLAMSTLSFQDYVRERMARKRHEAEADAALPNPLSDAQKKRSRIAPPPKVRSAGDALASTGASLPKIATKPTPTPEASHGITNELQAMKAFIEDRFDTLTWLGQTQQSPVKTNIMLKLIRAGYSPALARSILAQMPAELEMADAVHWSMDMLRRNFKTDPAGAALHEEGGIFALMGATGVGKTTSAAKLAGLCARIYGSASVGLITLDTYRVGAQEQLRAYGKMLGVVAHVAHDRPALQDLLGLLASKKMVLIDTTGLAPKDPRKREMLDLLNLPQVKRLLVLNAGAHADTLDDVVSAFKTSESVQLLFSKVDEAVKLGPAIDAAIRHQLTVRAVTMGQRVPEDVEIAHADKLIRASMRNTSSNAALDPKATDLGFIFNQGPAFTPTPKTGI